MVDLLNLPAFPETFQKADSSVFSKPRGRYAAISHDARVHDMVATITIRTVREADNILSMRPEARLTQS